MTTALVKHVVVLPQVETAAAVTLPVPQATEDDPLPMVGASINGRVHPGGRPCTWHVEYGATTGYGSSTAPRSLPGKLTAHYLESFAGGAHGFRGGLDALQLSYQSTEGGFIRKAAEGAEGIDDNHASGIGLLQLPVYFLLRMVRERSAAVSRRRPSRFSRRAVFNASPRQLLRLARSVAVHVGPGLSP